MFSVIHFIEDNFTIAPPEYNWKTAFDKAIGLEFYSQKVYIVERNWDTKLNKMSAIVYFVKKSSIFRNDNKLLPVYSHTKEFELSREFKMRLEKMRKDTHAVYLRFSEHCPYIQDEYHGLTVLEMFYKYDDLLKDKFIMSMMKNIYDKLEFLNRTIVSLNIETRIDSDKAFTFDISDLDIAYNFIKNKETYLNDWLALNCY